MPRSDPERSEVGERGLQPEPVVPIRFRGRTRWGIFAALPMESYRKDLLPPEGLGFVGPAILEEGSLLVRSGHVTVHPGTGTVSGTVGEPGRMPANWEKTRWQNRPPQWACWMRFQSWKYAWPPWITGNPDRLIYFKSAIRVSGHFRNFIVV